MIMSQPPENQHHCSLHLEHSYGEVIDTYRQCACLGHYLTEQLQENKTGYATHCRCVMLRALCDLRCEKDDARYLIELSQKSEVHQMKELSRGGTKAANDDLLEPVRHLRMCLLMPYSLHTCCCVSPRASARQEPCTHSMLEGLCRCASRVCAAALVNLQSVKAPSLLCVLQDDFNKECWGEDAAGNRYWLHDLGDGRGLRLCREGPLGICASASQGRARRCTARRVGDHRVQHR